MGIDRDKEEIRIKIKMTKFDERYDIRLGKKEDIACIMCFIDRYWKKDHILAKDKKLFEYEFLNGELVNMILAIERNTGEIEGIFGFLYCSNGEDEKKIDLWGSLWKVVEEHNNEALLGIELAKRVYELTGCRMHIGSGANPETTIPLRRIFFQDKTGKMKQYYCLNSNIQEFQICKIEKRKVLPYAETLNLAEIVPLPDFDCFQTCFSMEKQKGYPYKDYWYIEKRFYKHPYYTYQIYGLKIKNEITAVVICREVEVQGNKALRIIDYIGDFNIFAETGFFWKKKMEECGYEYIDFFEFGLDDNILENAGFVCRENSDKNIIPNYFEPFLQENIDIWVHYKLDGTTFFKGDCDQDRPNLIRKENTNC